MFQIIRILTLTQNPQYLNSVKVKYKFDKDLPSKYLIFLWKATSLTTLHIENNETAIHCDLDTS